VIFLLDTNAANALNKEDPVFMEKRLGFSAQDFGISSIVAFEMFYGAFHSSRVSANLLEMDRLRLEIVPFDREDARAAGRVRADLQRLGTPIGPYDVLIAGQAMARGLALISRNIREFSRVPGLRVENWQS
jgi:tRNA(fMet)-specific endonuclease VapC